jgi:hypothetical protein
VLVALTFYTFSSYQFTSGPAPVGQYGGLMERVLFIEILAWYAAVDGDCSDPQGSVAPRAQVKRGGRDDANDRAADARQRRARLGGGDPVPGRSNQAGSARPRRPSGDPPGAALIQATIAPGLAATAVAVRRAGGPGATLAVVTGRCDRQLAGKQAS